MLYGRVIRTLLLAAIAGPLGASAARAETLDWNLTPWPGTSVRTATYTVGAGTVTVTFTDPANVIDGSTSGGPASLATNSTLSPPSSSGDNLFIKTNDNSAANTGGQYVTVDILFSHAGGVADVSFSLFDVDQQISSGFTDEIYLEASDGVNTYAPTSVTALHPNPRWTFDGSNTITGIANANSNSERGTAVVAFNGEWLNRVSFQLRNTSDPAQIQFIGLSSINFRQAPEPSTALLLGFGLALLSIRTRRGESCRTRTPPRSSSP
jgi:hypothetical protein